LRDAEKALDRANRQRDQLLAQLNAASGHSELARLGEELATAQAAVTAAEETWLALAEEGEVGT
jgi:hypothetical protein